MAGGADASSSTNQRVCWPRLAMTAPAPARTRKPRRTGSATVRSRRSASSDRTWMRAAATRSASRSPLGNASSTWASGACQHHACRRSSSASRWTTSAPACDVTNRHATWTFRAAAARWPERRLRRSRPVIGPSGAPGRSGRSLHRRVDLTCRLLASPTDVAALHGRTDPRPSGQHRQGGQLDRVHAGDHDRQGRLDRRAARRRRT